MKTNKQKKTIENISEQLQRLIVTTKIHKFYHLHTFYHFTLPTCTQAYTSPTTTTALWANETVCFVVMTIVCEYFYTPGLVL